MRTPSRLEVYEGVRDQLRTGDIVAFSGKGRVSGMIKWATRSRYSHVGVLLVGEVEGFGRTVLLCESTTLSDLPDAVDRTFRRGVQIQLLSQRLDSYDGSAWWLPLVDPLEELPHRRFVGWLRETHVKRTPYDDTQAIGAGIDFWDSIGLANDPDFSRLFCSELVARAFQVAGILPPEYNASEATPADIVGLSIFGRRVELIAG